MKHLKTILLLICCTAITACGKKEEPVAEYEVGDKTVKVYENSPDQESQIESFELLNSSITLECGETLSTDISTYIKTKHPENIEMSGIFKVKPENLESEKNRIKFPYETAAIKTVNSKPLAFTEDGSHYYVAFRDSETQYYQYMIIDFVDTTMPTYVISSDTCDIYLKQLGAHEPEYKIIDDTFQNAVDLFDTFGLQCDDTNGIATAFLKSSESRLKSNETFIDGQIYFAPLSDIVPKGLPGTYHNFIIIEDASGNRIEIPITFNVIDDLSPEDKQLYQAEIDRIEASEGDEIQCQKDNEQFISDLIDNIDN